MGFCGDRIGPASWWLRFAPPFYPPSFGHGHPKRGGKRTLFSEEAPGDWAPFWRGGGPLALRGDLGGLGGEELNESTARRVVGRGDI
jgi:hypothetical protein